MSSFTMSLLILCQCQFQTSILTSLHLQRIKLLADRWVHSFLQGCTLFEETTTWYMYDNHIIIYLLVFSWLFWICLHLCKMILKISLQDAEKQSPNKHLICQYNKVRSNFFGFICQYKMSNSLINLLHCKWYIEQQLSFLQKFAAAWYHIPCASKVIGFALILQCYCCHLFAD